MSETVIERKDFHKLPMVWMVLYQTSSRKLKLQSIPGFMVASAMSFSTQDQMLTWAGSQSKGTEQGSWMLLCMRKLHSSCAVFVAFPATMSVKENIIPGVNT